MQNASIETVSAQKGEAAFILQVRPPAHAQSDALTEQITRFTNLYLASNGPDEARFAELGPMTWAITAPVPEEIETLHSSLTQTLFGDGAHEHVELARQPDPETDDWEPAQPCAATRAAMDGADILDLDSPVLSEIGNDLDFDNELDLDIDEWLDNTTSPHEAAGTANAPPDQGEPNGQTAAPEAEASDPAGLAAELAAFRREMYDIAHAIPAGSGDPGQVITAFREELENISGAFGQRADGAAQRIETAAERILEAADANRFESAAERAERSAELLETGVREALAALTQAARALDAAAPETQAGEAV
jgi:hypothetical protein